MKITQSNILDNQWSQKRKHIVINTHKKIIHKDKENNQRVSYKKGVNTKYTVLIQNLRRNFHSISGQCRGADGFNMTKCDNIFQVTQESNKKYLT